MINIKPNYTIHWTSNKGNNTAPIYDNMLYKFLLIKEEVEKSFELRK